MMHGRNSIASICTTANNLYSTRWYEQDRQPNATTFSSSQTLQHALMHTATNKRNRSDVRGLNIIVRFVTVCLTRCTVEMTMYVTLWQFKLLSRLRTGWAMLDHGLSATQGRYNDSQLLLHHPARSVILLISRRWLLQILRTPYPITSNIRISYNNSVTTMIRKSHAFVVKICGCITAMYMARILYCSVVVV